MSNTDTSNSINFGTPPPPLASSSGSIMTRLSIMMFLEFFIWGAWYVTMATYMGKAGLSSKIGLAYTLSPLAAIVSPFFLGMIADRFFASERVLAVMHLLGAVAMFFVPMAAQHGSSAFLGVILLHTLCYMPTINLTNSVAFANLTNQEKQFPLIRVFGTLGWIAAGLVVSMVHADTTSTQFTITAIAGVVLAAFSLGLPHTPPPAAGKKITAREIMGLDALSLFKNRSFAVFAISSFLICIPLAAYYGFAGPMVATIFSVKDPANTNPPIAAVMSVGQGAEVLFMLIMPLFFARLGVKWMLAIGMLSWVARYALFAFGAPQSVLTLIIVGIALHGLCYDFFFVTGFIYTDKRAPKEIRNQAQGLLVLLTYGLGLGIGAYLMGEIFNRTVGTKTGVEALAAYQTFWLIPAGFALLILVFFVALFRDDSKDPPATDPQGFEVK